MAATREVSSHSKSRIGALKGRKHKRAAHTEGKVEHGKHDHVRKKHHKKRRRPKHHKAQRKHLGTATPALPTAPVSPPAPSSAAVAAVSGPLSKEWANRLLWRAGFGPKPGDVQALTGKSVQETVYSLTRPSGPAILTGPEPTFEEEGKVYPLDPVDMWGQDHCWWLDRMIRSDQQLVERMTFIWHDWFATSNDEVDSQQLMLDQNNLFREMAFGSFHDLFLAVTTNPAMLLFLNGTSNTKWNPNENYGREMMELFSLGADRGAYTEDDVRAMARALTGWTNEWSSELGDYDFHFEPEYHDEEDKTIFGQTGNFNYEDAINLCVNHPLHASFFVTKLWGYFIPTPPDEATLAALQGLYTSSNFGIRPVLEAILQHPDFYEGQELVTPPVVYNAGLMRSCGRYVDSDAWAWLSAAAGQQLFYPPNVSGWDFTHWLDTSTVRARWEIASYVTNNNYPDPWKEGEPEYDPTEEPGAALYRAMTFWGTPMISGESELCIKTFAESCLDGYTETWQQSPFRAMRQNALRMLIATSPDLQVS